MNDRVSYIDCIKGIGICFVLFAHLIPFDYFPSIHICSEAIYMPIFFIISGFLTTNLELSTIHKRINKLFLSYIFFSILLLVAGALGAYDVGKNTILGLLYSRSEIIWEGETIWLLKFPFGPLWFITAMISMYFVLHVLLKCRIKNLWSIFFISITLALGIARFDCRLPWSFDNALLFLGFFITGQILRKINIIDKIKVIVAALGVIIFIWSSLHNGKVNLSMNIYGNNFLLGVFNAILGTILLMWISKRIVNHLSNSVINLMLFIGRNSLAIFCTHMGIYMFFQNIFDICFSNVTSYQSDHQYWQFALIVIVLAITLLISNKLNELCSLFVRRVNDFIGHK